MSKFAKMSGLSSVVSGLEGMADGASTTKVAVGTPVDYGRFLEEGTRKMPPYPWLEPAIDGVESQSGSLFEQADDIDQFIQTVAAEIERSAIQNLESTGQRPYRQSGNLAGSVETEEL